MVNALMNPGAKSPMPTIDDAKRLYLQEKVGDPSTERGRKKRNDVDRVFRLMKEALGERARRPLAFWTDADARDVRDHMMQRTKAGAGGAMVKPSSVRRELNVLASVWKEALKGFDLNKGMQAVNIFAGMNIPQEGNWSEKDGRDYDGDSLSLSQNKTNKSLVLPCTDQLKAALDRSKAALGVVPIAARPILIKRDGNPISYRNMADLMLKERKRLGLEAYDLHALRYRGIKELAWARCDDDEIATYSGHATKAMIIKYAAEARQEMRARQAREKRQ